MVWGFPAEALNGRPAPVTTRGAHAWERFGTPQVCGAIGGYATPADTAQGVPPMPTLDMRGCVPGRMPSTLLPGPLPATPHRGTPGGR